MYNQKPNVFDSIPTQNDASETQHGNPQTYENVSRAPVRKVLDGKYLVVKTIGQGRYAK